MERRPRFRFGRFELDPATRSLTRSGERIDLQAKVLDVILHLIEHRDRVVTAAELLDVVWASVAVTPSALSRAIYKARRALGDDGDRQSVIVTVRGRGFRFAAALRSGVAEEPVERASDFVGRRHELLRLERALGRALSGQGGLLLLSGEPGIGKTRTALEFVSRARATGAEVHFVRCPEASGAPAYWPWRELARALAEEHDPLELQQLAGREVADFLQVEPGLAALGSGSPTPLPAEQMRFRLFESAVVVLRRLAGRRLLVLVVDDVHAADLPSLAFLSHLAHALAELRVLVLVTFRDAEVAVDPPRLALLGEAVRAAGGETLVLGALAAEEVASLADKCLGRPLGEDTLAALCGLSGGNPFFLRELLGLIEERGEEGLSAAVAHPGALALPAPVRAAVEGQLAGIGAQARPLLSMAAALGNEFTLATLEAASGTPHDELLVMLGAAVAAHVLEPASDGAGRFRFAHALLREALYEDVLAARS